MTGEADRYRIDTAVFVIVYFRYGGVFKPIFSVGVFKSQTRPIASEGAKRRRVSEHRNSFADMLLCKLPDVLGDPLIQLAYAFTVRTSCF